MPRRRRSIRLPTYDYSSVGAYYLTVCTHGRTGRLGDVLQGQTVESEAGAIVRSVWQSLPARFERVTLDAFVVMPNHIHGIVVIGEVGAIHELPLPSTGQSNLEDPESRRLRRRAMLLPRVVGYLKMNAARRINAASGTAGQPVWQRGYYEHVVRSPEALDRIRRYIRENPARWPSDRLHPDAPPFPPPPRR